MLSTIIILIRTYKLFGCLRQNKKHQHTEILSVAFHVVTIFKIKANIIQKLNHFRL